jgi:CBS domain-containing protein
MTAGAGLLCILPLQYRGQARLIPHNLHHYVPGLILRAPGAEAAENRSERCEIRPTHRLVIPAAGPGLDLLTRAALATTTILCHMSTPAKANTCYRRQAAVAPCLLREDIMDTRLSVLLAEKAPDTHTIDPYSRVMDAVRYMNNANVGALVALEHNRVVGIFTERDVMVRVVAADRDPMSTKVSDVMTREPVCVTPAMSVREAMVLITGKRFRHLPVVQDGRLLGVISSGDLTRWLVSNQQHEIDHLNAYITDTHIDMAADS